MFNIKSNFRAGSPISQVPVSWFNKVANFLNNLVGGYGIKINKSGDGVPTVALTEEVTDILNAAKAVYKPSKSDSLTSDVSGGSSNNTTKKTFKSVTGKGLEIYIATRGADNDDGETASIKFRKFIFSGDGRVYAVEGETGSMGVYLG